MPLTNGEVFAGYSILRPLGAGGMGEVYLVQHPRLPRQEALKVLPADVSADPAYRQRFAREADLAASLWHPHIVEIHDRGEYNNQLWITMDYVAGTDAARLVRDHHRYGMPVDDALKIVTAIAEALDYAHQQKLLHRDVKPANILIAEPGPADRRIVLADFGIARDTSEVSGLTPTNVTIGTIDYAAPEQLMGRSLDGRADQYALACTAFHLLTGRPPFADVNPAAVLAAHLSAPPPRAGNLRVGLAPMDGVLTKAMAKEPSERFGSCREFAAMLTQYAVGGAGASDETRAAAGKEFAAQPTVARTAEAPADSLTIPRKTALIGGSIAALAAVGMVAFVGARLAQPNSTPDTEALPTAPSTAVTYQEPVATVTRSAAPPVTVTQPAPPPITVTRQAAPPVVTTSPPNATKAGARPGDLGLGTPISFPSCNGQGVVIFGSVTTPGLYAAGVQRLLDAHPGAFYLRTDTSCPSLRQATDAGNPIYAVFTPAGTTQVQVCSAVRAAGGNAYGKWLDATTDPGYVIPC
ncbi:serine/threonine-protein kinase [Mycolicibacter sinensis]|uniref:non-specific serine/threonine protein kinase n=1 Tax=Mycolicibacter sinensis (strain JDM601) TaxID=875328 RepID=A0A1A3TWG2_MYCSD|nr:serine/threonine-protein kinase [Mycolicibacter sinensis]OBK86767.1 serine/threonine protein kinase [Mycolicibacter sinensis]